MRRVVVNTTPIIALANIGCLSLLHELYDEVIIPSAVNNEIISEPARSLVDSCNWIKINNVTDDAWNRMVFSTRLHAGEAEVIMLAKECGADLLIIDDNAAKKTAKYLGMTELADKAFEHEMKSKSNDEAFVLSDIKMKSVCKTYYSYSH